MQETRPVAPLTDDRGKPVLCALSMRPSAMPGRIKVGFAGDLGKRGQVLKPDGELEALPKDAKGTQAVCHEFRLEMN